MGDKTDKQVISALVKKNSTWAKVTAPTINVNDAATTKANGWNPAIPAGTETVVDKSIYTAKFITDGQEITPGSDLPEGVFEVKVSRDETSVKDDALYGKSYAVFENSKLAKDKFPTPQAEDNFKDAKWNVEKPWEKPITETTEFKASATSATFDKANITGIEIIQDPTTMTYTEGEKPNHDGIKVKLTDKNGNSVEIGKDQLTEYGVTVTPTEKTDLTIKDHNGKPFVAKVNGKDAGGQPTELTANGKANITVNPKQVAASKKPEVNQPYVGDEKITGKGVPGASIVVKDKNGDTIGTTTVKDDKTWEVTVPGAEQLKKDEVITVTQTEKDKTPADETATVKDKVQPTKPTIDNPAAKNEPGKDTTTVTGKTDPNTEVTVTDKDGTVIGTGTSDPKGNFTIETKPKQDPGTEVTITPKDGTPAKAIVTEDGPNQSATPSINQPTEGDNAITGRGTPGAEIVVTDKDGKVIGTTTVDPNGNWTVPVPTNRPLKPGETITATQTEKGKLPAQTTTTVKAKGNTGITGGFLIIPTNPTTPSVEKPKHETAIHKLYIYGYEDNTFKPEGNMTRAEAAAMLARLQGLDLTNTARPNFIDVRSGWYNAVINAVVNAGYMKGYPDGTFRPDGKITRAEFAQMIKAIDKANAGMAPFADVKGHWAQNAIDQAYANGRITGYPDGTFRPNNHITRAEAVTIFNKLYDRSVGEPGIADVKSGLVEFNDINRSHWAYYQVVESSNTHEFYRTEKGKVDETWVRLIQTWKDALATR